MVESSTSLFSGKDVLIKITEHISRWIIAGDNISLPFVGGPGPSHSQLFTSFPHNLSKVAGTALEPRLLEVVLLHFLVPHVGCFLASALKLARKHCDVLALSFAFLFGGML